jgi:hypothetical protein
LDLVWGGTFAFTFRFLFSHFSEAKEKTLLTCTVDTEQESRCTRSTQTLGKSKTTIELHTFTLQSTGSLFSQGGQEMKTREPEMDFTLLSPIERSHNVAVWTHLESPNQQENALTTGIKGRRM